MNSNYLSPRSLLRGIITSAALACIATITIIMILEVVLRYIFNSPLGWNVYFIERYLMVGMVFLGLPYTHHTKSHVAVDVVFNQMSKTFKNLAEAVSIIVIISVLLLVIWGGAASAYDSWALGESPPPGGAVLPWPTWIWKSVIPLGASAMLLSVVSGLFEK